MRFLHKPKLMNTDHQRVIRFKGVSNFRDLGGYPALDGSRVKWGLLFRSGNFAKSRSADIKQLESLNIHTMIDFRSEPEKARNPNRLADLRDVQMLSLPILDPANSTRAEELRNAVKTRNFKNIDPMEVMQEFYQGFATENIDQFKDFIHALLTAQGRPVLWHCTSGKDRTGFAAAILLQILGVHQDIVIEDYLLSRQYVDRNKRLIFLLWLTRGKEVAKSIQKFFLVQEEWIRAAFQTIDDGWGSFENFSHEALDLSQEQIDQLRSFYLEST